MAGNQKAKHAKPVPIELALERAPGMPGGPRFVLSWAWPLPEHHLASVGIRALPRIAKGQTWAQWCQTSDYDLSAGYVFYSHVGAYGRNLVVSEGQSVEAMTVRSVVYPDGQDPGRVDFEELQLSADGRWRNLGSRSVQFGQFMAILKSGNQS